MELTWHTSAGEHRGFVPLQFLKENCYSDEIIKRNGKKIRPNEVAAAKMVGYVLCCFQLTCIKLLGSNS